MLDRDTPVKSKLLCVALNDREQVDSLEARFHGAPYRKPPTEPVLYYKPRNTWSHNGASVEIPTGQSLVVGASVGVVIGTRCRRVGVVGALDYVAGYCLVHDFSLPETSYYRPDIKGKCLDGSAPVGEPVPSSEVANLAALVVRLQVNGQERASLAVASHYRPLEDLLSKISYIMTLQPGEMIAIGFNGDRVRVSPGDSVTSTCSGLVSLQNVVSASA